MRTLPLVILTLILTACGNRQARETKAKVDELSTRVSALGVENAALRHDLEQLRAREEYLATSDTYLLQRINALDGAPAVVSGTDKDFEVARTDYGSFPVSVTDIQPHQNGYRVTLSIGNPLTANVIAGSISIKYGPLPPTEEKASDPKDPNADKKAELDFLQAQIKWKQDLQTVSQNITQPIVGGMWTSVDVIIAPVKADDLSYMEVFLAPTQITLHGQ
jgi:outer membrane murein-binding lipoprotein Lpp